MATNIKTTTTKSSSAIPLKTKGPIITEEIITTKKTKKASTPVTLPQISKPQTYVRQEALQPQILLPPIRVDKNYEERYKRTKYLRKLREDRMLMSLEKQTEMLEELAEEYRERNEDEMEDLREEMEELENENRELRLEKKYENKVQDQVIQCKT